MSGSIYVHCDPRVSHYLKTAMDSIFGDRQFRNEIVWHYQGPARKSLDKFRKKHDIIFWYGKTEKIFTNTSEIFKFFPLTEEQKRESKRTDDGKYYYTFPRGDYTDESIKKLKKEGRIEITSGGKIRVRIFYCVKDGVIGLSKQLPDVWHDIIAIGHSGGNDMTGYPTQKPRALCERIVRASSNG